jgi:hypothetical protein
MRTQAAQGGRLDLVGDIAAANRDPHVCLGSVLVDIHLDGDVEFAHAEFPRAIAHMPLGLS